MHTYLYSEAAETFSMLEGEGRAGHSPWLVPSGCGQGEGPALGCSVPAAHPPLHIALVLPWGSRTGTLTQLCSLFL